MIKKPSEGCSIGRCSFFSSSPSACGRTHIARRGVQYLSGGDLVPIRVHGGQDVDARVVDQPRDPLVSGSVLLAQKLGELNEQLAAEHFVAVHVAHVLNLGLHWEGSGEVEGGEGRGGGTRGQKAI